MALQPIQTQMQVLFGREIIAGNYLMLKSALSLMQHMKRLQPYHAP